MSQLKFLTAGLFVVAMLAGCGGKDQQVESVQRIAVEVAQAKYDDLTAVKTFSGTLEGAEQSKIYAAIPERVVALPVSEGAYVQAGEPIILLDKSGASSQYNQALAVYQNARDNFEKMQRLYDQNAISEVAYKSAKTACEVAEANFNGARATVELSSPINGIVTDIAVNLGEQVPLGVPVATIANTNKMRLTIYVALEDIDKMTIGKQAQVFVNSQTPIPARIVESSRSADPQTRLFRVELEMANSGRVLKPGMYARGKIEIANLKNVLAIQNPAIFSEEGIDKVYIIRNDSAFVRTVILGITDGMSSQVLSGLAAGEVVVVVGKSGLRDGMPVLIPAEDSTDVSG